MAKTSKRPRLTQEDRERIQETFEQIRHNQLRHWHEQSSSDDEQIRNAAQARLQVQLWLRERRQEIELRKEQRDMCKLQGDDSGIAVARKRLKQARVAMSMLIKLCTGGIPAASAAKACRAWMANSHTLDHILSDKHLDKRTEFGVDRDTPYDSGTSTLVSNGVVRAAKLSSDDDLSIQDRRIRSPSHTETCIYNTEEHASECAAIWTLYSLRTQEHYQAAGLPNFMIETRLATQRKIFASQVDVERSRNNAIRRMSEVGEDIDTAFREGMRPSWNFTLVTSTYSEHNLWQLTSPRLWEFRQHDLDHHGSQLTHGGAMRILTFSDTSHVYIDFGRHALKAHVPSIPPRVSLQVIEFTASSLRDELAFDVHMTFLTDGFVKVQLPLSAIISPEGHASDVLSTSIDLTGSWQGSAD